MLDSKLNLATLQIAMRENSNATIGIYCDELKSLSSSLSSILSNLSAETPSDIGKARRLIASASSALTFLSASASSALAKLQDVESFKKSAEEHKTEVVARLRNEL